MLVIRFAAVFFFAVLFFFSVTYANEPIIVDDGFQEMKIGMNLEYCEDADKALTIEDIISKTENSTCQWHQSTETALGFGYSSSAYWVRFTAKNSTNDEVTVYLQQRYPLINYLDLYIPVRENEYQPVKTGTMFKFSERPVNHRSFVFPLKISRGESKTYYMRYEGEGSMNIVLRIFSPQAFKKNEEIETILMGMVYGMMMIMIFYNFIIFVSVRDLSYLFYVLYLISFLGISLSIEGFAYQYLWPNAIWWNTYCKIVFLSLIVYSLSNFVSTFTKTNKHFPRIDKCNRLIAAISIVACIATLFPFVSFRVGILGIVIFTGLGMIYMFAITSYMMLKKSRQGQFVFGSFCVIWVGCLLYIFKTIGILPDTVFTNYTLQLGAVVQVMILSLGLADRIITMRKELGVLNTNLEEIVLQRTEELKTALKEIRTLAETDKLTGLYNRVLFESMLEQAALHCHRNNHPATLILFDLDHFKKINDEYGHYTGDHVLKSVGNIISKRIRRSDRAFRWGGEEFLILLYGMDLKNGINLAEELRKIIEEMEIIPEHTVTASFGVATISEREDWETWLKRCDKNLYQAKESGRNRVVS